MKRKHVGAVDLGRVTDATDARSSAPKSAALAATKPSTSTRSASMSPE